MGRVYIELGSIKEYVHCPVEICKMECAHIVLDSIKGYVQCPVEIHKMGRVRSVNKVTDFHKTLPKVHNENLVAQDHLEQRSTGGHKSEHHSTTDKEKKMEVDR